MPVLQSSFSETVAKGYPGMRPNGSLRDPISRTIESAAGIGFGKVAYRGSGDHGIVATQTLTAAAAAGTPAPAGATITASPAVALGARIGTYTATCITAGATGKWRIEDPEGNFVGVATTGTEFVGGGLTFTITDSGTDPAVGEAFAIVVSGNPALGITIANQTLGLTSGQTVDTYPQYENVEVETRGPVLVTAGGTVADGQDVQVDASGDFVASAGMPLPGWIFDTSGVDDDLVTIKRR